MAAALIYPVRSPSWLLSYAGVNITADISSMMTEFTYSDKDEEFSDELQVTLADRARQWQGPWLPTRGDTVTAQIGYQGEQMLDCGSLQVDELELTGPPDTFHLKCIAAGVTQSIRTKRSASYEGLTLLDVANQVAQRQGLTVVRAPQNVDLKFNHITQKHETDLHFLHRLATAHNYDFSIRGNQLIFYSRTALEQMPSVTTLLRTQTKSFEFKTKTDQIYKTATTTYQSPDLKALIGAQYQDTNAPTGDDNHVITRTENPQQAQLKADSALHQKNKDETTGRIETEGMVLLVAGVNITIVGFGNFDGTYLITSSRHRLERSSGYTTEIEARMLTDVQSIQINATVAEAQALSEQSEMFAAATLTGAMDGSNATFTMAPAPLRGVMVFLNGLLLTPGAQPNGQYTWAGSQLTFNLQAIPQPDMAVSVFTW